MTKNEAFKEYDNIVEEHEAKCTCQDYFNAGWDACENIWLTDNPDKDLMIAELEESNEKLRQESYKDLYVSSVKKITEHLRFFAALSATLASELSDENKLKRIEKEFNKIRNNL